MADAQRHTEAWQDKPWKPFQRVVFRLQKRIYRARLRRDQLEVHHRDGNRANNRMPNLALLHLHCHDAAHGAHDKGDLYRRAV